MVGRGASRELIAKAGVIGKVVDADASDSQTKLRGETLGADSCGPKNTVEVIERRAILNPRVVALQPPGQFRANAYLLVDEDASADGREETSEPRRAVQGSVAERIDPLAVGTVVRASDSDVHV